MELKLQATVTLDATPALIGALDRVADAMKGGETAPKTRTRAAKKADTEPTPETGEKAAEAVPAAAEAAAPSAQAATPIAPAPAAAPAPAEPAPTASRPAAATAPASAPTASTGAAKGIDPDNARRILIAVVQKHGCGDVLQNKLHELGYQTQYAMPDDVRADFVAWVRRTYPISDAEVL